MKVGTDGVLLGSWIDVRGVRRALDIGTGSGVIALMLAQRTNELTSIDGVEPSGPDAEQAAGNVSASPWRERVHIHRTTIQEYFAPLKYDLVVTNPPYFTGSQLAPTAPRKTSRHTEDLTHDTLLACAERLLSDQGRLGIILPTVEGTSFIKRAREAGLFVIRQTAFLSRPGRPQERWLLEFSRQPCDVVTQTLTLYTSEFQTGKPEEWSAGYRALVEPFYL